MKNFTLIPNELLENSQITHQARFLLCILLRYCGQNEWCYPSQKTLAKAIGLKSSRQVRTLLSELINSGLILKKRRGFNKSNTYKVAKSFELDRNSASLHLGSKFPLNQGTIVPPNNTYRKATGKKGRENLRDQVARWRK